MNYDVKISAMQARKLGEWAVYLDRDAAADVEIAVDDRMLIAEQGDERMAWDIDGSPAADEYLAADPLATPGDDRLRIVYVVRPGDPSEDVAAFWREEDAETYNATFDDPKDVERVTICGPKLAAEMIASRAEDEPTRVEIEQHALMQGATREEIAEWTDDALIEKYGAPGSPSNDGRNWDTA